MKILQWSLLAAVLFMTVSCAPRATNPYDPRCVGLWESELHCLYWKSVKLFMKRLESDVLRVGEIRKRQAEVIYEITVSKDVSRIPEAVTLIEEVKKVDESYERFDDFLLDSRGSGMHAWNAALEAHLSFNRIIAEMMLEVGKTYQEIGYKDRAGETYRAVVTIFTGTAYESQVRKAKFLLSDLGR